MQWLSLPQNIGYVAYAISFCGCLQKKDRNLFAFMGTAWLLFGLHHFFMGNLTACASGVVIMARMYLSIWYKGAKMAFPFAIIAVFFAVLTYQSPYSLLPLGAVLLATFGSAYSTGIGVRVSFMSGSCLWLIHNFAMKSIGGMALDITNIVMYSVTCFRLYKDKKKEKSIAA